MIGDLRPLQGGSLASLKVVGPEQLAFRPSSSMSDPTHCRRQVERKAGGREEGLLSRATGPSAATKPPFSIKEAILRSSANAPKGATDEILLRVTRPA